MTDQPTGRTPDEPDDVVVPDDLSSLLDGTTEAAVPDDAPDLVAAVLGLRRPRRPPTR